jgi:hypothetical protein
MKGATARSFYLKDGVAYLAIILARLRGRRTARRARARLARIAQNAASSTTILTLAFRNAGAAIAARITIEISTPAGI